MGYNTDKGIFSTHSRVINQLIALGVETRPF